MTLTAEIIGLLINTAPTDYYNDPVLEVLVMLTTESIGLLVCTVPAGDAKDTIIGVICVGRCYFLTHYCLQFNPFSIKFLPT